MKKWAVSLFVSALLLYAAAFPALAASGKPAPGTVIDISKENTYPNPTQDLPHLEPSSFTKQLLKSANVKIENPELIHLFNESSATNRRLATSFTIRCRMCMTNGGARNSPMSFFATARRRAA